MKFWQSVMPSSNANVWEKWQRSPVVVERLFFVSHNMGAVSQLCDRGVVLVHGGVSFVGPVDDALRAYA